MPAQLPDVIVSVWTTVAGPLQVSVAVALPSVVTLVEAVQEMLVLAGQNVKLGGVVSLTVMVCTQLELALPQPSVAMNRRLIV